MLIEWERIRDLRAEIGAIDFAEVVALFLEEADDVLAHIADCHNPRTFEADLHFLKGAALNLGFTSFASICHDGERHISTEPIETYIAQLATAYDLSKQALLAGLAKTDSA